MSTQIHNPTQYSRKIDFLEKEIKKLKAVSKSLVFSKNIFLKGVLKKKKGGDFSEFKGILKDSPLASKDSVEVQHLIGKIWKEKTQKHCF